MTKEIERRFLVASDAWRGAVLRRIAIVQFYVAVGDDRACRVRISDNERAVFTVKIGRGLVRDEFEFDIPLEEAEAMRPFALGAVIDKVRSIVPAGELGFEVDVFAGALSGLVIAELESVEPVDDALLPDWLGREITAERGWSNAELALGGMPAVPDRDAIDPTLSFADEVRRLVGDAFARATGALRQAGEDPAEALHQARRSIKRLRALYRLVRSADPRPVGRELQRLGAIGRSLGAARDATAVIEALDRLAARQKHDHAELATVRARLAAERDTEAHDPRLLDETVSVALLELKDAEMAFGRVDLPHDADRAAEVLVSGVGATLRRARQALKAAHETGRDEAFHTLRKATRTHAEHVRALGSLWPRASRRLKRLDGLARRLGDHNDLVLLAARLSDDRPENVAARDLVERERKRLATSALARADRVFDEPSGKMGRRARKVGRRLRAGTKPGTGGP